MKANLSYSNIEASETRECSIRVTGSKSESNRLLILQALYTNIEINNLSNCDDTQRIISALVSSEEEIDIHHAGTAMRFLTAYFAIKKNSNIVLTGSQRMQHRPIGVLVDALRKMGAQIDYVGQEGYPPLRIKGKELPVDSVSLQANISSQYITSLMLIGAVLPNGLTLDLQGKITSRPYIEMTRSLLHRLGIFTLFSENKIQIKPINRLEEQTIDIESDWSSASYYYSLVSLSEGLSVALTNYVSNSIQGDAQLANIYKEFFGVETVFISAENKIVISKRLPRKDHIHLDLSNTPDIAQTIAVNCFGLGMKCDLTGLHTLKIKETDRLLALKIELEKLGAEVLITDNSLSLIPASHIHSNIVIDTYQDHRMAMAFAPLALRVPIIINQADVVKKSYPNFWEDIEKTGIKVDLK